METAVATHAGGKLVQLTRDQTFAQELVEQGVFTREDAKTSPLNNVLSSALGAPEALPEITRVEINQRGTVILLCTDGLTKHVTNAEIAEHLANLQTAEQTARDLLQLALDRGGTDNISMVWRVGADLAGRDRLRRGRLQGARR